MFPHRTGDDGAKLADCAAGSFDPQWTTLARNLVTHRLGTTIVRPGWEFDGSWYPWAADRRTAAYLGCFRHIVDAMRAVPAQHFAFLWNPALGTNQFPATEAYPGDEYVDYVGVDVYDTSWTPASRAQVWNTV